MASAASKKKGKVKGKTLHLNDFLATSGGPSGPGTSYVLGNQEVSSWAEQTDDSGLDTTTSWNDGDYVKPLPSRSALPTAPRSAQPLEIDRSKLPDKPPYTVYLGNIPFDADEEDISRFLRNCQVSQVRLPREGDSGRLKGFGYAELDDMESLLEALQLNEQTLRNRRIRVDLASQAQSEGREGGHGGGFDRTEDDTDWRRGGGQSIDDSRSRGSSYGRGDRNDDRYGDRGGGFDRDRRGRGFENYEENRGGGGSRSDDQWRSNDSSRDRGRGFDNYNQDYRGGGGGGGYGRDRDGGRGFENYNRDRRDRYGDRDRYDDRGGYGGGRDRGYGGDRDRSYGGDRDRGYGGDRDRGYGGDRDRGYGGDRDRDRGGFDRDRGGHDRDRGYGGDRDRGYDDRGGRDGGGGRGYGGGSRDNHEEEWRRDDGERDQETSSDLSDPPRERKKLVLEKRTKPIEPAPAPAPAKTGSSIFGGAKPVDTAAREREIEERLAREREEAEAERQRDIERKERIDRGSSSSRRESEGDEGRSSERRTRHSSSGSGKSGPRPVMIRRESERSNPDDDAVFKKEEPASQPKSPTTPTTPKSPLSPKSPKSPKSQSSPPKSDEPAKVMRPAPPPAQNAWAKRSENIAQPRTGQHPAAARSPPAHSADSTSKGGQTTEKKYVDAPPPKENPWGKKSADSQRGPPAAGRGQRPSDSRSPPGGGGAGRGRREDDRRGPSQRDDRRGPPRDGERRGPPRDGERRGPRDDKRRDGDGRDVRKSQDKSDKRQRQPELPKYEEPKPTDWTAPNKFSSLMEDEGGIENDSD